MPEYCEAHHIVMPCPHCENEVLRQRIVQLEGQSVVPFKTLTDEQCDAYARRPLTFNEILKLVYSDSHTAYCGKANTFFGKYYREQFEKAMQESPETYEGRSKKWLKTLDRWIDLMIKLEREPIHTAMRQDVHRMRVEVQRYREYKVKPRVDKMPDDKERS